MPTTNEVRRRISFVNPPLMADIDRDGAIGDGEVAAYLGGKVFRFWTNEDTAACVNRRRLCRSARRSCWGS